MANRQIDLNSYASTVFGVAPENEAATTFFVKVNGDNVILTTGGDEKSSRTNLEITGTLVYEADDKSDVTTLANGSYKVVYEAGSTTPTVSVITPAAYEKLTTKPKQTSTAAKSTAGGARSNSSVQSNRPARHY